MRAKMLVAHHLDFVKQVSEQRGMLSYTGRYNQIPMAVISVGFGEASLLAWLQEAVQNGVRKMVYIGECVSLGEVPALSEVVLATDAHGARGHWPAGSNLLEQARTVANALDFKVHSLPVTTADGYWLQEPDARPPNTGVLDFATCALYWFAASKKLEALSVVTVSEQALPFQRIGEAERQSRFHKAARIAFDTLASI